ncbi:hypothetical protein KIPB_011015 [Kipferlia bialata]|uniref:Tc1-like transposase DDE domain-containing protein n=1 Tax=Kipferlia bialata TaxID=797122 RepID=A0A9K3D6R8_9EUKA|nr:hypothetical protein KIPB_011015 [Kipferlia bialata]|eukprot:g11015.t1
MAKKERKSRKLKPLASKPFGMTTTAGGRMPTASEDVRCLAIYAVAYLMIDIAIVSDCFQAGQSTIRDWKRIWLTENRLCPKKRVYKTILSDTDRDAIFQHVLRHPTLYLREIQRWINKRLGKKLSVSTVFRELHLLGLTVKKLETRSLSISSASIDRFTNEVRLNLFNICQLVFLDETAKKRSDCFRREGRSLRNTGVYVRRDGRRGERISILGFMDYGGIFDHRMTTGTFCMGDFIRHMRTVISTHATPFPGPRSVWIMDGASIHLSEELKAWALSKGVVLIQLSAYCCFFNPIELFFGALKARMQEKTESFMHKGRAMESMYALFRTLLEYRHYNFVPWFQKCGYFCEESDTVFDPNKADRNSKFAYPIVHVAPSLKGDTVSID